MTPNRSGQPPRRPRQIRRSGQTPWLPHRRSRPVMWLARQADGVLREFIQNVRPVPPPGRPARFEALIRNSFASRLLGDVSQSVGGADVQVEFLQAFGKPMVVSFDISVTPAQYEQMEAELLIPGEEEKSRQAYSVFVKDILDSAARAMWDNPEVAPVALRGRILIGPGQDGDVEVLHDLSELGFPDEIARPVDAYERYGPPASDPAWKP